MKLIGILLMALASTGFAQAGQNHESAKGTGTVYIFRNAMMPGHHISIFCDGTDYGKLGINDYFRIVLPAGHHYCTAFHANKTGVDLDLKAGDELHFGLNIRAAYVTGGAGMSAGGVLVPFPKEAWDQRVGSLHQKPTRR
jgi:hypothetical protein